MANALFGIGRANFLIGDIHWDSDNIKFTFVDSTDYTLAIDTHDYYDDITAGGRVGTSGNLSSKTYALGVADAADETVNTVTGDQFEYIILWMDSSVEATSPLIACIDTATGLPCTPNGGNITVQWDAGANKIFKL